MQRVSKAPAFNRDFAIFVDDLGGLLWSLKTANGASWDEMGHEVNCNKQTLANLANRKTKNPTMYTCWRILRGLDHASVIRHSQLERYRGISKPAKVVKLKPKAEAA
jgi:DNA-binding XRE family transcriptional regulator